MSIELTNTISALRTVVQSVGSTSASTSDAKAASFAAELGQLLSKYETPSATIATSTQAASVPNIPTAPAAVIAAPQTPSSNATATSSPASSGSADNLEAILAAIFKPQTASSPAASAPSSALGTKASETATAAAASAPWAAPWVSKAAAANTPSESMLLADKAAAFAAREAKPGPKEFMAKTGCDFITATKTLYGVMGSNVDLRDWSKIMASANPLTAARQATAAQYASKLDYRKDEPLKASESDILAKSGPYAWVSRNGIESLWITDGEGNLVTNMKMTPQSIYRTSRDFGVDPSHLADLAAQIDSKGLLNSDETNGRHLLRQVNLRDIASGGLGSASDWRSDPAIRYKGSMAIQQLKEDQALALELGIRPRS